MYENDGHAAEAAGAYRTCYSDIRYKRWSARVQHARASSHAVGPSFAMRGSSEPLGWGDGGGSDGERLVPMCLFIFAEKSRPILLLREPNRIP